MSVDPRQLLGKTKLSAFERQYLLDRNMLDHPGLGEEAESTFLDTGYQGNVPDGQSDTDTDGQVESWEDLKIGELQKEAEARGVSKSGTKPELIARIEKFDAENPPAE